MILRAGKSLAGRKRAKRSFAGLRFFAFVYIFWGALIITGVSFISLSAGVIAFALFAAGLFALSELYNRRRWEASSSFKLMSMEDKIDALDQDISRNRHSVERLKRQVTDLSAQEISIDRGAPKSVGKENIEKAPASFSALSIANDDPFADHKSLSDMVVKELVQSAVAQKRIDIFAQPVVRLPQRQPAGFEIFARIRAKAGLYVPAGRYMNMAKSANLQGDIDTILLKECLSVMRERAHQLDHQVFFINIQPDTLKNKKYMSDLLAFVAKNRTLAKKLVFEIRYADYQSLPAQIFQIIGGLSKLGCAFSLDNVDDCEFHLQDLIKHNIRYMKIRASWIAAQGKSDMDFTNFWRLKNKLESNGVRIIADHIEQEGDLRALLDFDPHYGQGYLFAKPDLIGAFPPFSYVASAVKRKGYEEKFG
ncbi:MAG: EAL domain-containing protein [Alphaproteobacteria bacterium]